MPKSLEINKNPDLPRSIRLWIRNNGNLAKLAIGFIGGEELRLELDNSQHHPIIVKSQDHSQTHLKIDVIEGNIDIGSIEINYSWKLNQYLLEKYPDQINPFISLGFDISSINDDFLEDLKSHDLFESSGPDGFSATTNLIHSVMINDRSISPDSGWINLVSGDSMLMQVYMTTPAYPFHREKLDGSLDFSWIKKFDQSFIEKLDTKFYEFVDKKLADRDIVWSESLFTDYKLPYAYKIRMQSQLLDNKEFIEGRDIVDLGCHRGQFLYPCLQLGCKTITGVQPLPDYNSIINDALFHLGLNDRGSAIFGNAYDLPSIKNLLKNKDTLLMLGLIYHLHNHYELMETITGTDITALIIDVSVESYWFDHYQSQSPSILYYKEATGIDENGWELDDVNQTTFVGVPNAKWIIMTLEHLGWTIKSNTMLTALRTMVPNLRYRGVITAYR